MDVIVILIYKYVDSDSDSDNCDRLVIVHVLFTTIYVNSNNILCHDSLIIE